MGVCVTWLVIANSCVVACHSLTSLRISWRRGVPQLCHGPLMPISSRASASGPWSLLLAISRLRGTTLGSADKFSDFQT